MSYMDSDENKEVKVLNLIDLNQMEIEIGDDFVSNSSSYWWGWNIQHPTASNLASTTNPKYKGEQ